MKESIYNYVTEYGKCERCGEIGHNDGFWAYGFRFLMCRKCHERTVEEWYEYDDEDEWYEDGENDVW